MKDQIKELRVKIDGLAQLTEGLKPLDSLWGDPKKAPENAAFKHIMVNSKQINQAVDSLYLAKAWLGKVLEALSEEVFKIDVDKLYHFTKVRKGRIGDIFNPNDEEHYQVLGKDLSENEMKLLHGQWLKDNESPYKSGYKTVEDIVPTADKQNPQYAVGMQGQKEWLDKNHIEKCDWLREEIRKLSKSLPETKPSSRFEAIAWTNAYNYICEARFWLGFELERIKEESNENKT